MIGEFTATISGLTTVTTTYTAADQMGSVAQLTGVHIPGAVVEIVGATVTDDSGVLGAFDLVVFAGAVAPTLAADNAAAALSVADGQAVDAVLSFAAANLVNVGGRVAGNWLPISGRQPIKLTTSITTLWIGLIARTANAVFAGGATSIRVSLWIDRP